MDTEKCRNSKKGKIKGGLWEGAPVSMEPNGDTKKNRSLEKDNFLGSSSSGLRLG
jgi:hypothetical protein